MNHSAVLASFFLKEELGRIGKIGCALCLVGSVIIVLHAPEDKEIETVDQILRYAMQPGAFPLPPDQVEIAANLRSGAFSRFHVLLSLCTELQLGDDIPDRSGPRAQAADRLHLNLFTRWIRQRHGHQGFRGCY